MSFGIRLENRYKGIRMPHKLKGGVSGCIRECAEAQSKDFGLIGTENGYNLYVCGNGGSRPRHATLFASDIDEETVIKYLDRFLVLYIRTSDKLERTVRHSQHTHTHAFSVLISKQTSNIELLFRRLDGLNGFTSRTLNS